MSKKHLLCGNRDGCELGNSFDTPCTSMMPCFFILDDESKREYYEAKEEDHSENKMEIKLEINGDVCEINDDTISSEKGRKKIMDWIDKYLENNGKELRK